MLGIAAGITGKLPLRRFPTRPAFLKGLFVHLQLQTAGGNIDCHLVPVLHQGDDASLRRLPAYKPMEAPRVARRTGRP